MPVEDQADVVAGQPESDANPPRRLPPARARVRVAPTPPEPAPPAASDDEDAGKTPSKSEYEVGYGKPPKHTQFKPGNNANPKGRPKGAKSFWTEVDEELAAIVIARMGGRQVKLRGQRVAAKAFAAKLMKGESKAVDQWVRHQQQRAGGAEAASRADPPLTDKENAQIEALIALLNGQPPPDEGTES